MIFSATRTVSPNSASLEFLGDPGRISDKILGVSRGWGRINGEGTCERNPRGLEEQEGWVWLEATIGPERGRRNRRTLYVWFKGVGGVSRSLDRGFGGCFMCWMAGNGRGSRDRMVSGHPEQRLS